MNKEFLFNMLKTPSAGGCEVVFQRKIADHMAPFVDKVNIDFAGNVYSIINPENNFKVLFDGHADEICLRVVDITSDGYLKVTKTGGVRPQMYLGHKVRIFNGKETIFGAVVSDRELYKKDMDASELFIDIGATSKEDASKYVNHGDWVLFDSDVRELKNDRITSRALDDKAGVFIINEALKKAKMLGCDIQAAAVSSTGEETCGKGAFYASSRFKPNIAIVVDVTYATDFPSSEKGNTGAVLIGSGPVLDNGVSLNRLINKKLSEVAKSHGIPIQYELSGGNTYTDEEKIQYTNMGVPCALVSLPLRNMHSAAEVASLKDIENCIDLLAYFICEINESFDVNPFNEIF